MTNKIPKSRIELQKLKIEVLRKYLNITCCIGVLNICAIPLYVNPFIQIIILAICAYLLYRTAKTFNILIMKETEIIYKMIEENEVK